MKDIIINDISKTYGDTVVFDHFSYTLRPGGIYTLSSGSGTGKTTLLRMLMGLEAPDTGSIAGIPDRIGAVFQENRLIDGLSVLKNISLVCPDSVSASDILRDLARTGLEGCASASVNELSGGMQRRVALVRACLYPCELLLLDEPFTGLDSELVAVCTDYLLEKTAGRTCIVAGHIRSPRLDAVSSEISIPHR